MPHEAMMATLALTQRGRDLSPGTPYLLLMQLD